MADVLVAIFTGAPHASRSELAAVGFAQQAAQKMGGSFDILVLGPNAAAAADSVSQLGARKVLLADNPDLRENTGEAMASAVAAVAKAGSYRLIAGASATNTR